MVLLFLCLSSQQLEAQKKSREFKRTFLKADKAFDYSDYLGALSLYNSIYAADSNDAELNYKIGVCMFEIKKYRRASLRYFEKTSTSEFPEANYYLGWLYHLNRNYEKSIASYTQYKYLGDADIHSRTEINDLISKCNTAKLMESKEDRTLQIKNLGDTINTEYPEYAPLIPAEENYMIFTSRRKNSVWTNTDPLGDYFEDMYVSKRVNKLWLPPQMMDTAINTAVHDAGTGLSADGEKLLMYRTSKDLKSGDIYESHLVEKKWSNPQPLGTIVNSPEFLEPSACYSADGNSIFFSSNRPGGFGGKDIYQVKKLPNGNWGTPFNLGPTINTPYNEDAPFLHPAENTLFFSSEGHENMGGYDIFKSSFDETSHFTPPQNMGCPVNTVDDDIFFVLNTDASMGYLSSERQGGYGSQDIYSVFFPVNNIPLTVYNIHVFDESGEVLTSVEMVISDMPKKAIYGVYKANPKTGKIMVISPPDVTYRMAIQCEGYEPFITNTLLGNNNELIFKLRKIQK